MTFVSIESTVVIMRIAVPYIIKHFVDIEEIFAGVGSIDGSVVIGGVIVAIGRGRSITIVINVVLDYIWQGHSIPVRSLGIPLVDVVKPRAVILHLQVGGNTSVPTGVKGKIIVSFDNILLIFVALSRRRYSTVKVL